MNADMNRLVAYAIGVGSLAIVDLTAIAVITGFKDTGLVDNSTADTFIAGLVIFGTFIGVVVVSLIGKIIINLYQNSGN